jgi:hypothetical protein
MMDVAELNFLSQLQAKREAETRVAGQQRWGLKAMAAALNGAPAIPAAADPAVAAAAPVNRIVPPIDFGSPGGLMNRSPITNNHYHTYQTAPAPPTVVVEPQPAAVQPARRGISPLWLAIPFAIALGALAWALSPKKPAPAAVPPPAQPTLNSTIRWSQVP